MTAERKLQGIDAFLQGVLERFPNIQALQDITAYQLVVLIDQLEILYDRPVIHECMILNRQEVANIDMEKASVFVQLLMDQRKALQQMLGKKSSVQN